MVNINDVEAQILSGIVSKMETDKEVKQKKIEELKEEVAKLIYEKLRIYSNISNIEFRIDYDYIMTTSVVETNQIKKNGEWRTDL